MSKIALVDDDRNILTSVSMTLEVEGFEVETDNDGQSALDAFNRKLPDMAVLDIKMPRMDGMELLQRLRQKTNMPIISKQIVEVHDGVIWAENIRPTQADVTSAPLGARLVVGLPL